MAGKAAPKAVLGEQQSALAEMKMRPVDDQMEVTRARTDRAIAGKYLDLRRRQDIKTQAAAVTGTCMKKQLGR